MIVLYLIRIRSKYELITRNSIKNFGGIGVSHMNSYHITLSASFFFTLSYHIIIFITSHYSLLFFKQKKLIVAIANRFILKKSKKTFYM